MREGQFVGAKRSSTSNAVEILRHRYVKDDFVRESQLEAERMIAQVARMIYDQRTPAGMYIISPV